MRQSADLRFYLAFLRRWWWVLIVGVLALALPTYYITDMQPRTYRASTTILVNQAAAPGVVTYNDALLNQQLVKTYSRMAQQPVVLDEVVRRLPIPFSASELDGMVSVAPVRDTQLLQISVTGRQPIMITDIANVIAEVFIEQQREQLPAEQESALRVTQPALVPTSAIGPNPLRNALLAGILGLVLCSGLALLYEYLDDTLKTPEHLAAAGLTTAIGNVPRQRLSGDPASQLVAMSTPRSSVAEAYRLLRTNLEFAALDHPLKSILVTSANPDEGKSTVASNLAVVLAQSGLQVILVDADLRRPSLHRLFNLHSNAGLTNMLLQESPEVDQFLQPTAVEGLRVLTSGPLPPNPAELVSSARFTSTLEQLVEAAGVVIIDSPPLLGVADPIVLASRVDGTLVVVDSQKTRTGALRLATDSLAKSGTRMLGYVLNNLGNVGNGYYYGRYYGDDVDAAEGASRASRASRFLRPGSDHAVEQPGSGR